MENFIKEHSLYEECKDELKNYAQAVVHWHYEQNTPDSIKKYESMAKKYFDTEKEFKKFIKQIKTKRNFLETIFGVINQKENGIKRKIITILGIQIKLKPEKITERK